MPADREATFGCPHFPACPGCPWVGRPYADQLTSKHLRVTAALAATLPRGTTGIIAPVAPAPEQSGYRVQAKLMVGTSPRGVVLGLYAPGSHRILDVSRCPLHDPLLQRTIPVIRDALADTAVPLHRPAVRGQGRTGVRYVLARVSVAEARVLVTLVSSRVPLPDAEALARRLRTALPLAGLLVNENTSTGNVILGSRTERIWGEAVLRERYGAVTLTAGPTAFVQANSRMAARIYAAIAAAANLHGREHVLDLYCGVGGIALTLAPRAGSVLGIEEIEAAVAAAQANAERAGAQQARFVTGRVEEMLADHDGPVDVVTMNPPRKGCRPGVIRRLAALAPSRLLYLSCNPESFARDAAQLSDGGFVLERVQPFDLLPQTEHVELLGVFVRAARPRHPRDNARGR
jgi:23S rRNA (uracil1939-C5)-methyltransferase